MARLFNGNAGTSSYNAAEGKFNEVDSTIDPTTGLSMVPYKFADTVDFAKKSDLSLAGNMMGCGECHIGGGAMQYIPNASLAARPELRTIATVPVPGFGGTAAGAPITAADVTAFNYFIDNYDVDQDGLVNEVQYMDYAKTGVMEMDCFICHLPGYDYQARYDALRAGKIDATRAIGAGFAADNGMAWPSSGQPADNYGTTVVYDNSLFTTTTSGNLRLSEEWMHENIAVKPDSNNCANCHMNEFSVDWKKRGDHWAPNGQYDFQYEVHSNLGCMGCHERKPTAAQPENFTSVYGGPYPTMGAGMLGHDPAKGDSQYSGLYNKNDKAGFKNCYDCHGGGEMNGGESYAAPNPAAAHAAAGLTAAVAQGNTADGVAKISHIDMMHCSACHSRKAESYDWNGDGVANGNTGNPLIDATGGDHEKRLTDHENDYVIKQDMTDQTSLAWYKGKLHRVSPSATMFWRDKNDMPPTRGGLDANQDGRPHGMDALLMTQVLATNTANGWGSITEDNHGDVSPADFAARISALKSDVQNWVGVDGAANPAKIKFSIFHVNFMNQHAVSPAAMAFGAGGCTDCHDAGAGFYNGSVDTTGTANTMNYGTSTSQRVPFTKVNGFSQASDWHPNQFDKFGARTIAIQIANTATTCDADNDPGTPDVACMTTRPVNRSENMYENTFMGAADFAASYSSSAAINFGDLSAPPLSDTVFTKGWQLIVQVNDGTERLKMVSAEVNNVTDLITNLGTTFTDGTFGFTVTDNGAGGITITGTGGNLIRVKAGNCAYFNLTHAAYKATPWNGVLGGTYNGRADWVAYLDGITAADLPDAGVATIAASVPATVEVGTAVTLAADESVNAGAGNVSYSWISNDVADEVLDGASVSKTFDTVGTWTVTLKVIDVYGNLDQISKQIQVTAPAPLADISSTDNGAGNVQTVTFANLPPTYTMLYVIWGDGLKEKVYPVGSPASVDVDHTFRQYSKYINADGDYQYRATVYVYNGSSRLDIKREYIIISP